MLFQAVLSRTISMSACCLLIIILNVLPGLSLSNDELKQLIDEGDADGIMGFMDVPGYENELRVILNNPEDLILEYALFRGNTPPEVLFALLLRGANPNVYMLDDHNNHILSSASTIDEILIFLVFGANPHENNEWEWGYASNNCRLLHVAMYHLWDDMKRRFSSLDSYRPKKYSDYVVIKEEFPLRRLERLVEFINSGVPYRDMSEEFVNLFKDAETSVY